MTKQGRPAQGADGREDRIAAQGDYDASMITLHAESGWVSPWVLHVMTALEEKRLPYQLALAPWAQPSLRAFLDRTG